MRREFFFAKVAERLQAVVNNRTPHNKKASLLCI
jgi:hypothetical protein